MEDYVGEPSPDLVAHAMAQIRRSPGLDYTWPGNVRELEQCVRRILLRQAYVPLSSNIENDLEDLLHTGIREQNWTGRELVGGYCLMLHQKHRSIEAVARATGLDRRTAKKHIGEGRQRFAAASGNPAP